MINKIMVFLIVLFLLNVPVSSQNRTDVLYRNDSTKCKYALGLGAGFTTGYGLAFKFTPHKFGLQTVVFYRSNEKQTRSSIGLTLLYTLLEDKRTSFYLYQGNHLNYTSIHYDSSSSLSHYNGTTLVFNNGVGLGVELIPGNHIGFDFMGGYAFFDSFTKLSFTGEIGIYYNF